MSRVKTHGAKPEFAVRKLLSKCGVRYRLNRHDLIGKPDVYVPRRRLAIFINGCFWHGDNCRKSAMPKVRVDFWKQKLGRNAQRDQQILQRLKNEGVESLVLWECESSRFPSECAQIVQHYKAPL